MNGTIVILILFVVYTVCCCLDAPEVKAKREQIILDWCCKKVLPLMPFKGVDTVVFETRYKPIIIRNKFVVTDYYKFVIGEENAIELAEEASVQALLQNILLYKNECIEITKDTDPVSGYTRIYSKIQVLTKQNNYK